MTDRSFFLAGLQFPVCARDTGLSIGIILAMILGFVLKGRVTHWFVPSRLSAGVVIALSLPMVFDGITTYMGLRNTTNDFRVFTGLICGGAVGTVLLFALSLPAKAQTSSDMDSQRSNCAGAWVLPILLCSLGAFLLVELALVVNQPLFYLPLAIMSILGFIVSLWIAMYLFVDSVIERASYRPSVLHKLAISSSLAICFMALGYLLHMASIG